VVAVTLFERLALKQKTKKTVDTETGCGRIRASLETTGCTEQFNGAVGQARSLTN
jgi:hypothetical protein